MIVDDPTVSVRAGRVDGAEFPETLQVWCSECGDVTDWDVPESREALQRLAFDHAQQAHDGLVIREGWA